MFYKILNVISFFLFLVLSIYISDLWQGPLASSGQIYGVALIIFMGLGGAYYGIIEFIRNTALRDYPIKLTKGLLSLIGFIISAILIISIEIFVTLFHLQILIITIIILISLVIINEFRNRTR